MDRTPSPSYELIRDLVSPPVLGDSLDIALLSALAALDEQKSALEKGLSQQVPSERGDTIQALLVINRAREDLMEVLHLAHPEIFQN